METTSPDRPGRPSVLSLEIKEVAALYAAYMPQLRSGGIFIPTVRQYRLGDEVFLLIALPDDGAKLPVTGKVVWITPEQAQAKRAQGIGVQFNPDEVGRAAKRRIEAILIDSDGLGVHTHTV